MLTSSCRLVSVSRFGSFNERIRDWAPWVIARPHAASAQTNAASVTFLGHCLGDGFALVIRLLTLGGGLASVALNTKLLNHGQNVKNM